MIKARMCSPEFKFEIWDQDFIQWALENSRVFDGAGWVQQYETKTGYVYLVKGNKVIEMTGDIAPHYHEYIVTSLNFKCYVDMLIHFPHKLEQNLLSDLVNYLYSVVNGDNISLIPEELCKEGEAYIYPPGNKSKNFKFIKYALQEFLRLLTESEVSKHPYSTYVIKPTVSINTYASAVKNTKKEIKNINKTSIPKTHQSVVKSYDTLSTPEEENSDFGSTSKERCSHCENDLQKNVGNSQMTAESQLMEFSQQSKYINPNKKSEKSGNENSVSGYNLRSKCGSSKRMSNFQALKQVFEGSKDPSTEQAASYDSCVMSVNEPLLNNSENLNKPNIKTKNSHSYPLVKSAEDEVTHQIRETSNAESDKERAKVSEDAIMSKSVGDKVTNLSQEIHKSESGKAEAKVSHVSNMCNAPFKSYEVSQKKDEEDFGLTAGYLKPVKEAFNECGMMRKYYGVHSEMKEKTIILLGASGSGKTTLVNFIANYFKGVKSADGELVHVVRNTNDVRSYTTSVTAYTFCSSEHESPITVIDTPGLNDSSGAEVRDHVQSLKTFLANAASQNLEIHGIGFVAQAHLVRLTSSERLVMDYVSTLFGEGIEDHFFTFITFADNLEMPPVVEAIKNYGVKCNIFLKFNNSSLSNNKTDEIDDLDRVYWRIGSKSWRKCMKSLQNLPALSVNIIKSLQSEVYASTVIDSAERALRTEIKTFIGYMKRQNFMTKEGIHVCEKVWELAAIVHHFRSTHLSDSNNVEDILAHFAEEVCKDNGIAHYYCMKLLSLAPSRILLNTGIGIIQSTATIYREASESLNKRRTPSSIALEYLYCHKCDKHHELRRTETTTKSKWSLRTPNAAVITYKCTECECDADIHGEKPFGEDPPEEYLISNNDNLNTLLEHTGECITKVIKDFSTSEYLLDKDYYLNVINEVTGQQYGELIHDLLQFH
ncbi:hypothetical protein OTU49_006783 [Cherax quadricarinatus]|uniref:AAA+ ATPase domain-containing protein n=2 Tax=Cherax quadricarinatus TaxID=27406 RepID=A0AAW0WK21_CHEQU